MKIETLRKKLYAAIFGHDAKKEKKIWFKILKKSFKHKHTQDVQ